MEEKIAAALLRVSSNQQDLESQKNAIKEAAEKMGYTIPDKFYFGEKISGDRPQFIKELDNEGGETGSLIRVEDSESLSKLKEACQNPKTREQIEMIFIWEMSRLSRRKASLFTHLEFFNILKKPIHFIHHKLTTLNLSTLEVDKMTDSHISFLSVHIEQELSDITKRMQRGKKYVFENDPHRYVGGRMVYGYKVVQRGNKSYIEINDDEAEIVKLIFDKYVNGRWSFTMIANFLNGKKIPSPLGKLWEDSNVGRLLHRRNYIGERKYGKWQGTVPAIISKELFDKVEEIIEDKRGIYGIRKREFNYPLKPIIKCGVCKRKLQGITCASRKLYYDEHININNFRADAIVWDVLQKTENFEWYIINQKSNKKSIEKEIEGKRELFSSNRNNITDLEKERQRLLKVVRKGIYTIEEIEKDVHEIDVQIRNYTRENGNLRKEIKYLKETLDQSQYEDIDLKRMIEETGNDISRVEYLFKKFIREVLVYNYEKNWVVINISFTGPRHLFCLFNRQSKKNIYYTLVNDTKDKYIYYPEINIFQLENKEDEYATNLFYLKDFLSDLDKLPKHEYKFIQEDIFSSIRNEKEKAKQKRWNEQRKQKLEN